MLKEEIQDKLRSKAMEKDTRTVRTAAKHPEGTLMRPPMVLLASGEGFPECVLRAEKFQASGFRASTAWDLSLWGHIQRTHSRSPAHQAVIFHWLVTQTIPSFT